MIACLLAVGEVSGSSLVHTVSYYSRTHDTNSESRGNAFIHKERQLITNALGFSDKGHEIIGLLSVGYSWVLE